MATANLQPTPDQTRWTIDHSIYITIHIPEQRRVWTLLAVWNRITHPHILQSERLCAGRLCCTGDAVSPAYLSSSAWRMHAAAPPIPMGYVCQRLSLPPRAHGCLNSGPMPGLRSLVGASPPLRIFAGLANLCRACWQLQWLPGMSGALTELPTPAFAWPVARCWGTRLPG